VIENIAKQIIEWKFWNKSKYHHIKHWINHPN